MTLWLLNTWPPHPLYNNVSGPTQPVDGILGILNCAQHYLRIQIVSKLADELTLNGELHVCVYEETEETGQLNSTNSAVSRISFLSQLN